MKTPKSDHKGFTLVEILIAMVIFIIILAIASSGMLNILHYGIITMRSEASNVEGIVGVEVLRHDLEQAGFGLFNDDSSIPIYSEAAFDQYSSNDSNIYSYNTEYKLPRSIVTVNNIPDSGLSQRPDYLVIKGTTLGSSTASQKWTTVDDTGAVKFWGRDDFNMSDRGIVVDEAFSKEKKMVSRTLITNSGAYNLSLTNPVDTNFHPPTGKSYFIFGIDSQNASAPNLRAPFNRVDYYVKRYGATDARRPPDTCSPASGVLYKSTMNHSNGSFRETPVLDCVADMQIVLGLNTTSKPEADSSVQFFVPADFSPLNNTGVKGVFTEDDEITALRKNPQELRRRLKMVIVYLLVQDGQRDMNFVNTENAFKIGSEQDSRLNQPALIKTVDLTASDYRNYRWKLYRIVVKPRNS